VLAGVDVTATRTLSIIPPVGTSKAALEAMPLILTQTDSLLHFAGSGDAQEPGGGRVQHVQIVNLTLAHTSAQFFLPHEETSGGETTKPKMIHSSPPLLSSPLLSSLLSSE
jgi:hypothetical protein